MCDEFANYLRQNFEPPRYGHFKTKLIHLNWLYNYITPESCEVYMGSSARYLLTSYLRYEILPLRHGCQTSMIYARLVIKSIIFYMKCGESGIFPLSRVFFIQVFPKQGVHIHIVLTLTSQPNNILPNVMPVDAAVVYGKQLSTGILTFDMFTLNGYHTKINGYHILYLALWRNRCTLDGYNTWCLYGSQIFAFTVNHSHDENIQLHLQQRRRHNNVQEGVIFNVPNSFALDVQGIVLEIHLKPSLGHVILSWDYKQGFAFRKSCNALFPAYLSDSYDLIVKCSTQASKSSYSKPFMGFCTTKSRLLQASEFLGAFNRFSKQFVSVHNQLIVTYHYFGPLIVSRNTSMLCEDAEGIFDIASLESVIEWHIIRSHLDKLNVLNMYKVFFWLVKIKFSIFETEFHSMKFKQINCHNLNQFQHVIIRNYTSCNETDR